MAFQAQGIRHLVFRDLFLEDIRAYRTEQLSAADMEAIFPLWKRDTSQLARDMIAGGLVAHIVRLDPRKLPRSFSGPMFDTPIPVMLGDTVDRDGFGFTDIIPVY